MSNSTTKAQDVFLNKINPVCKRFGLNQVMAHLYAILYFSDEPLSLGDMTERLNISKGGASTNIRALERYGAVRRVWIKGSRKDYYEADKDISKLIKYRVGAMAQERLSEIEDMISSSYEVLNSIDAQPEEKESFRSKLDKINTLYNQAKAMFELFNSTILNNVLTAKPQETADSLK